MPTRSSRRQDPDPNVIAFRTVQLATGQLPLEVHQAEPVKNPHAVALGKLGGAKGGRARAKKLSPKERADIAMKAARARWKKKRA